MSGSRDNRLQWMWADAGVGPLKLLAQRNPLRWSSEMEPEALIAQLNEQTAHPTRPVSISAPKHQSCAVRFENPSAAASWIREVLSSSDVDVGAAGGVPEGESDVGFLPTLTVDFLKLASVPALSLFCRVHSTQDWLKKQIFASTLYAKRVTSLPMRVAEEQFSGPMSGMTSKHPRVYSESWDEFWRSSDAAFVEFVTAITPQADPWQRPGEVVLPGSLGEEYLAGSRWVLVTPENSLGAAGPADEIGRVLTNPFFSIYARDGADGEIVVAFRGGDGGTADAKTHPGSPARSFVQGEDLEAVPSEIVELNRFLKALAGRSRALRIRIVGYSQGAIPALATFLMMRGSKNDVDALEVDCALLNSATVFWPHWLYQPGRADDSATCSQLLPHDWWSRAADQDVIYGKITSWLVKTDPLSESMKGTDFKCPQFPGTTKVLPARSESAIENHSLEHFKRKGAESA